MRFVTENGIADIIEVRRDGVVEQNRIFYFRRIAHHAIVADDDVLADVGVMTNLAIAPDDGRAFDHRAVLHHRAFADKNLFADERDALAFILQRGLRVRLHISLDSLQRVPGVSAAFEQRRVRGLAQVKQIGGFEEHGTKLGQSARAANLFLHPGTAPEPPAMELPLLHQMEERAGERRSILTKSALTPCQIELPSPQPSPTPSSWERAVSYTHL